MSVRRDNTQFKYEKIEMFNRAYVPQEYELYLQDRCSFRDLDIFKIDVFQLGLVFLRLLFPTFEIQELN